MPTSTIGFAVANGQGISVNGNNGSVTLQNTAGLLTMRNLSGGAGIRFTQSDNTEWVRITSSGKVGIGTPGPANLLDVAGAAAFGSQLYSYD